MYQMADLCALKKEFEKIYGEGGEIRFFASPGRVNLIGEHTDYNGGYVFPAAISAESTVAVRKRDDRIVICVREFVKYIVNDVGVGLGRPEIIICKF